MRQLVPVIFLLLMSACSTIPNINRFTPLSNTRHEDIQNYALGETMRAYVGQAIIEKGSLTYTEVSEGKYRALYTLSAGAFHITQGGLYLAIFVDSNDGGIYVQGDPARNGVFGAKVDRNGYLMNNHMFYYNLGGWQDHALTNIAEVGTKIFEPTPTTKRYSPESFKLELLYLGLAGGDIRVSYREYRDDIARPAFFQELTYNLDSSDVIRYRNFRIKVLNATNEEIEYILLEH